MPGVVVHAMLTVAFRLVASTSGTEEGALRGTRKISQKVVDKIGTSFSCQGPSIIIQKYAKAGKVIFTQFHPDPITNLVLLQVLMLFAGNEELTAQHRRDPIRDELLLGRDAMCILFSSTIALRCSHRAVVPLSRIALTPAAKTKDCVSLGVEPTQSNLLEVGPFSLPGAR